MAISFSNNTTFRLRKIRLLKDHIKQIIILEGKKPGSIHFQLCNDDDMLEANRQFLNHDYYTDIITFPLSDAGNPIDADILISIDTVLSNSVLHKTDFEKELMRVFYHGVLHLCGYSDKSKKEKVLMRAKEDFYLQLFI